ncbi:Cytochrome c-552 (fragment) [Capnocytophaga canimorsus]|uniref:nitrite reductase (cytochrome; ammonia-forming) n=1 Tax=Capnocytophaga canimorsus TaxID=28188 RepID=A0A0B7IFB2_9FLAO
MKKKNWLIVGILAVVTFLLGMLANSIMGRKAEAQIISRANTDIKDFEARNEIWGEYYQREYQSWLQTADTTFRAKYMSSDNDDLLAERPEMVILWAGYAFSKDYTAPRGHMHAVADVTHTLRTGSPTDSTHSPQPSTCWTCKSPDVPRMMNKIGIENYYKGHWDDFRK